MASSHARKHLVREPDCSVLTPNPAEAQTGRHLLWRWLDRLAEWGERRAEMALLAHLERRVISDLQVVSDHADTEADAPAMPRCWQ